MFQFKFEDKRVTYAKFNQLDCLNTSKTLRCKLAELGNAVATVRLTNLALVGMATNSINLFEETYRESDSNGSTSPVSLDGCSSGMENQLTDIIHIRY